MEAIDVIRVLADPQRFKVLAAVALGAADRDQIAERSGMDSRGVLAATSRLASAGLITGGPDDFRIDFPGLRDIVRQEAATREETSSGHDELSPFVAGRQLKSLPSKRARRHAVLAHIVRTSFDERSSYDEKAVNEVLERWCEGSGVDHVAMRRYLIDHQLMFRVRGVYARSLEVLPAPGEAERYMDAIGLG